MNRRGFLKTWCSGLVAFVGVLLGRKAGANGIIKPPRPAWARGYCQIDFREFDDSSPIVGMYPFQGGLYIATQQRLYRVWHDPSGAPAVSEVRRDHEPA